MELAPLRDQPEAMRTAWQEANDTTGGKPTAAAVKEAREAVAPRLIATREPTAPEIAAPAAERDARRLVLEELYPSRKRASTYTAAQRVARYALARAREDKYPPPSWSAGNVAELSPAARTEMVGTIADAITATNRSLKHLRELSRVLDGVTSEAMAHGAT